MSIQIEIERANYLKECYDDTLVQTFRCPEHYDYSYLGYKKRMMDWMYGVVTT